MFKDTVIMTLSEGCGKVLFSQVSVRPGVGGDPPAFDRRSFSGGPPGKDLGSEAGVPYKSTIASGPRSFPFL